VLGAFNQFAPDKTVSQVRLAMRANSIARIELVVSRPVHGKRLAVVIEAGHVLLLYGGNVANADPSVGSRSAIRSKRRRRGNGAGLCIRARKFSSDVVRGITDLSQHGGDNLSVCRGRRPLCLQHRPTSGGVGRGLTIRSYSVGPVAWLEPART